MKIQSLVLTALTGASLLLFSYSPAVADDESPRGNRPADVDKSQPDVGDRGLRPQGPPRFGDGPFAGGGPLAGRDPAQFVPMLMRQFDKNEDKKLDTQELTALLAFMRDRRAQMGGQPPMGPMQANRLRPGGMEGRRGGDGNDDVGGVTPKRPPMEE